MGLSYRASEPRGSGVSVRPIVSACDQNWPVGSGFGLLLTSTSIVSAAFDGARRGSDDETVEATMFGVDEFVLLRPLERLHRQAQNTEVSNSVRGPSFDGCGGRSSRHEVHR